MLQKIIKSQLKNYKTVSHQTKVGFSQERLRNYFEVNPIYPDYKDFDGPIFRDQTKVQEGSNQDKLSKIKKSHMKHIYQKSKSFVQKQMKREKKFSSNKDSNVLQKKTQKLNDRVTQIAESILVDQESQLMFGFGFDDFIQQMKEQKTKDQEGEYLQKLQYILHKLNIKNDTELVNLYKYIIAEKTQDQYRDESRKIIIRHILLEIQNMKKENRTESKVLNQYLDSSKASNEFVLSSYQEGSENEVLSKELEAALKEQEVNNISSNVAFNEIQNKINVNKEIEVNTNRDNKVFSSDFSEDQDLFYEENDKLNEMKDLMGLKSRIDAQNESDWKTESIYKEIKNNFRRNKELYQEELEKDSQKATVSTDFFSFLEKDAADKEIENLFRQYGFTEDKFVQKPEFGDILENIDYLIDNAPISLKSNVKSDSNEFSGNYINSDVQESDLLWQNFSDNFLKIFPSGKLADTFAQQQTSTNSKKEICGNKVVETIYTQDINIDQEDNLRNHVYTEKDLPEDQRVELEVYRRVKTDPFFSHYLQNDLKYFSERMLDGFNDTQRYIQLYDKSGDILNYNEPEEAESNIQLLEEDEPDVKMKEKQEIEKELKQKVFAGGKRKKSHCLAILTKGSGKVTINRKKYLDYFPHPVHRNVCLKPIFIANIACMYDVDIHVRGGGAFGQSEAISVAITRAIVKIYPHLRSQFIDLKYIQTDPRKKERKKLGQYKARKGWTYVRR